MGFVQTMQFSFILARITSVERNRNKPKFGTYQRTVFQKMTDVKVKSGKGSTETKKKQGDANPTNTQNNNKLHQHRPQKPQLRKNHASALFAIYVKPKVKDLWCPNNHFVAAFQQTKKTEMA